MTATTTKVERKTGSGGKASAGLLLAEELRIITLAGGGGTRRKSAGLGHAILRGIVSDEVIDVIRVPQALSCPARRHGLDRFPSAHRPNRPAVERMREAHARQLGERLRGYSFVRVFTSPLHRATKTCELAGFGSVAEVDSDLIEWDYGSFEGQLPAMS